MQSVLAPTPGDLVDQDGHLRYRRSHAVEQAQFERQRHLSKASRPVGLDLAIFNFLRARDDPTADLFELVVSWSSDDLDSSLPELIEREIRDIEWDCIAGRTAISKGATNSVTPI
jgi:hypothetical protein